MSLSERHRWCMSKMLEAFAPELSSEAVQSFIRADQNLQKFNAFFKGDSSGRMFVFYQPHMGEGEAYPEESAPKFLSLSDGSNGLMTHKCCYFIRNVANGVALDLAKRGTTDSPFADP
eukprot:gene38575-43710_t